MDFTKVLRRKSIHSTDSYSPAITQADSNSFSRSMRYYSSKRKTLGLYNEGSSKGDVYTSDGNTRDQATRRPKSSGDVYRSHSIASERALPDISPSLTRLNDASNDKRPHSRGSIHSFNRPQSYASPTTLPAILEKKYIELSRALQNRSFAPTIIRWDPITRTIRPWNAIKNDPELFDGQANVLVHFHEKRRSRHGPALKVSFEVIDMFGLQSLFSLYEVDMTMNKRGDGRDQTTPHQCDIYIPAPEDLSKAEATNWHVTTRNLFALLLRRPLVGTTLGQAFIEVAERLQLYRPNDPRNLPDFKYYLEHMGYLDFTDCPDYALAVLNFAEHFRLRDLWIDAFAHCVGMSSSVSTSQEHQHLSFVTHALLEREIAQMQLHLEWAIPALSNFMAEELFDRHFKISYVARVHLHRFRRFLGAFYAERLGYWPPPSGNHFSRSMYTKMCIDFKSVYDFLADTTTFSKNLPTRPIRRGIPVAEIINAFDENHHLTPLPFSQPLLPSDVSNQAPLHSRGLLQRFRVRSKPDPVTQMATCQESLSLASNQFDGDPSSPAFFKAYQTFELDSVWRNDENISVAEGRKVRWLLIYQTLQILIFMTGAPAGVRNSDSTYPLCCSSGISTPWQEGRHILQSDHLSPSKHDLSNSNFDKLPPYSIKPDCDTVDFFPAFADSEPDYSAAHSIPPQFPPTRIDSMPFFKTFATQANLSSCANSISSRSNSTRKLDTSSQPVQNQTISKFCEITVQGYGNGLNEPAVMHKPTVLPSELSGEVLPEVVLQAS